MKRPTPITAIAVSTAKPIANPIRSRLASDGLSRRLDREYACAPMADEATEQDGTVAAPDGIDPKPLEAWFGENVPGVELPAALRADRRRPLEPHLSRHRRRRREVGAAAAAARQAARLGPRHGARVQGRLGAGRDRGAGGAGGRALRGRERQRRPLLRDGVRRGADPARPRRGGDLPRRGRPAGDRRARRRHPGRRSTPSIPTRSASATSAARRTTSPASCTAGRGSGRSRRRASWSRSTASTRRSRRGSPSRGRRRSSTATTASTT